MSEFIWLLPAFPLAGFLLLAVIGTRLSRTWVAVIGAGSVGLSAATTALLTVEFLTRPAGAAVFEHTAWTWMQAGDFSATITFHLDALSLLMVLVVTFVGLLIHIYSTAFMRDDAGYSRFFAYMNLFVAAMLILVLAGDLVLLYLGWEGVGLCSYLLIGFWYDKEANGHAAQKAFIVTRVGDAAMAVALLLLFTQLGTLEIGPMLERAVARWPVGSGMAVAAAALLLGGAVGKSAQVPLQVWLPDAMAGPSPVSALIHAATMVTAGVYLIARLHVLYMLAPAVQTAVAVIAAVTILLSGCSALVQRDIKRVLAYSTVSQIGYMFLALGVGAWSAAMFHFMTHAFFKALLFLAAGVVISSLGGEHDMFKMGGLRRRLPLTFWTFLIGASSLAAVPLVTAGFYSKDGILAAAWTSPRGSVWLWVAGWIGALLTSLYTFRMVFLVFFGWVRKEPGRRPSPAMLIPMVILALLSIFAGLIELPSDLGDVRLLSGFLHSVLPAAGGEVGYSTEVALQIVAAVAVLGGIAIQYYFYILRPDILDRWAAVPLLDRLRQWWYAGWGFDWLYDRLLVRPYTWLAEVNRHDVLDLPFTAIAQLNELMWLLLSRTQTGSLRWYAAGIVLGSVLTITILVFS